MTFLPKKMIDNYFKYFIFRLWVWGWYLKSGVVFMSAIVLDVKRQEHIYEGHAHKVSMLGVHQFDEFHLVHFE